MGLSDEVREFIQNDVCERFLRYVQIHTTSDESSQTDPSTPGQWDLLRLLAQECQAIDLCEVQVSDTGYTYAALPGSAGSSAGFGLLAHVDTSPEQPGDNVRPVCHQAWDGSPIRFVDDPKLELSVADCPQLEAFVGDTIITASGSTLLGADDKAGVAEIMSAMAALQRFPDLPRAPVQVCFSSDEEIGRGTRGIDLERLPQYCYTIDGGLPGELEDECFDAWRASIVFHGIGVHPGYATGKMVNAAHLAARFLAELPAEETPERTADRDGFYYVYSTSGGCERAEVQLIVRDFESTLNRARLDRLQALKTRFEEQFPGLVIELTVEEQYRNMREILAGHAHVVELAARAIEDTGLTVERKAIRGGTDGSLLCQLGHPTPNLFAGGVFFHSRREWVAERSLVQATETILHLARRWAQ